MSRCSLLSGAMVALLGCAGQTRESPSPTPPLDTCGLPAGLLQRSLELRVQGRLIGALHTLRQAPKRCPDGALWSLRLELMRDLGMRSQALHLAGRIVTSPPADAELLRRARELLVRPPSVRKSDSLLAQAAVEESLGDQAEVRRWENRAVMALVAELGARPVLDGLRIRHTEWSPDDNALVAVTDNAALLYDTRAWRPYLSIPTHGRIPEIQFSASHPDRAMLAISGTEEGVWAVNGRRLFFLKGRPDLGTWGLSGDGKYYVWTEPGANRELEVVRVYDEEFRERLTITSPEVGASRVEAIQLSSQGARALVLWQREPRGTMTWADLASGAVRRLDARQPEDEQLQPSLSPEGRYVAWNLGRRKQSAQWVSPAAVWDSFTGRTALLQHPWCDLGSVPALFSQDSRTLAVGGGSYVVCLWDVQTERLKRTLPTPGQPKGAPDDSYQVSPYAWTSDGRGLFVSSTVHGTVLWDTEAARLVPFSPSAPTSWPPFESASNWPVPPEGLPALFLESRHTGDEKLGLVALGPKLAVHRQSLGLPYSNTTWALTAGSRALVIAPDELLAVDIPSRGVVWRRALEKLGLGVEELKALSISPRGTYIAAGRNGLQVRRFETAELEFQVADWCHVAHRPIPKAICQDWDLGPEPRRAQSTHGLELSP